MNRIAFILILVSILHACSSGEEGDKQGIKELERAIEAIEDRRSAEYDIIEEQKRSIRILEENLERVNSQGMRDKINKEITEKRVTIGKAEKNLRNQEEILKELNAKRDSLIEKGV